MGFLIPYIPRMPTLKINLNKQVFPPFKQNPTFSNRILCADVVFLGLPGANQRGACFHPSLHPCCLSPLCQTVLRILWSPFSLLGITATGFHGKHCTLRQGCWEAQTTSCSRVHSRGSHGFVTRGVTCLSPRWRTQVWPWTQVCLCQSPPAPRVQGMQGNQFL